MRLITLALGCLLLMSVSVRATTVIPPTFETLVSSANTIFVGEVMNVRAEWIATPKGRAIMTHVIFKVEDVWKGAAGSVTQLDFLGGTIGRMTMEVVGMPTFHEGQRSVLFVSGDAVSVSPLVGFFHGRLRIERDVNGIDRVRTYDGRSLANPDEVGANKASYMASIIPMRLSDLATAVRGRVVAARAR